MATELLTKLAHLRPLRPEEEAALRDNFTRVKPSKKSEAVFSEGEDQEHLYVVKSGWFYSYAILTDGSRQIHEIFTAGDVIGIENLSWLKTTSSVACAVSGELYVAPIAQTRELFRQNPNLEDLFQGLQRVHSSLLIDRLTAVSRLDAYNRIAFFLSDALTRQNLIADVPSDQLFMPLSQSFIADCLGLSSVHVSRQFGKLMMEGLMQKIGRKMIKILDTEKLRSEGDYKNRFSNLILTAPLDQDEMAHNDAGLPVSAKTFEERQARCG